MSDYVRIAIIVSSVLVMGGCLAIGGAVGGALYFVTVTALLVFAWRTSTIGKSWEEING